MKAFLLSSLFLTSFLLAGCGQKPMSDADLAKNYGLSPEEFQEQKEAAARMNMSITDHLKMMEHEHGESMEEHAH